MVIPTLKELMESRAHFGHLLKKKHRDFGDFVYMDHSGIQIIDLKKTQQQLAKTCASLSAMVQNGQKILFVGTKSAAKELVKKTANRLGQPYVVERWMGGTLTNFRHISQNIKKLRLLEDHMKDKSYQHRTKKEQLGVQRKKQKLEKLLAGLAVLNRLPAALFVVDVIKEHTAVREARHLNIPVFAIVDTNGSPVGIQDPIPANDDAQGSIQIILKTIETALLVAQETRQATLAKKDAPLKYRQGNRSTPLSNGKASTNKQVVPSEAKQPPKKLSTDKKHVTTPQASAEKAKAPATDLPKKAPKAAAARAASEKKTNAGQPAVGAPSKT